jgi:small neutral amino acid transporter SnatA (MarC family)
MIKFFGISLPFMQVSGGLVLAAMEWQLSAHPSAEPR